MISRKGVVVIVALAVFPSGNAKHKGASWNAAQDYPTGADYCAITYFDSVDDGRADSYPRPSPHMNSPAETRSRADVCPITNCAVVINAC
jgi:hypothetical protein